MRCVLASIGSAGDLNPVIGLAVVLRRRGHDVTIACNPVYRAAAAAAAGTEVVDLGTVEQHERALATPDAWHPRRGIEVLARELVCPAIEPLLELIAAAGKDTVVAATTLALGARVAEEKLGNPTATLHLQPASFRSLVAPPVSQGFAAITKVPVPIRRIAYWAIDRVVDPLFAPTLDRLRGTRTRHLLADFIHSPRCTLGLFPPWFAPPQRDWVKSELTDFIRYDGAATELAPELAAWLDGGPPPIVFTAGTAMQHAEALFAGAIAATERLGRRGVILAGRAHHVPALPPSMRHVAFAPLGALAARSAALVHHGGIGTAARALEAGIPQVVIPMAHDQFDNAARLARLGVGRTVKRDRVGTDLAPALDAVLTTPAVADAAAAVKAGWRDDGAERTADRIEALAGIPSGS